MGEAEHGISGWGRVFGPGREIASEDFERLTRDVHLSRGLARSYGDASLPDERDGVVASSRLFDRVLDFDPLTGVLTGEAGLSLQRLNALYWRRRFAAPVAPGTQLITLGGMVAADVHGKDHHSSGSVGAHVESLRIRLASGDVVTASRAEHGDLFRATIGGMGLLGHILDVRLRLQRVPSCWLSVESERISNVDAFLARLSDAARTFPFTMGWIDTLGASGGLGRGILLRGRWATPEEAGDRGAPRPLRRPGVPFVFPDFAMSRLAVSAFNAVYFAQHIPRVRSGIRHPESFFYPLDAIRHWNRLYGSAGFTQYQCVIPAEVGADGVRSFLALLRRTGGSSMLSVIKDCGDEGIGMLSFPRRGTTLALDLPVRDDTQRIVDTLNAHLIDLGGRVYLAKDRFTTARDFARMEARLDAWREVKKRYDPGGTIRSALSSRLELF
jgi:FAD/FMN-containing dehydrogenase